MTIDLFYGILEARILGRSIPDKIQSALCELPGEFVGHFRALIQEFTDNAMSSMC